MKENGKYYPIENGLIPLKGGKCFEYNLQTELTREKYQRTLAATIISSCEIICERDNPIPTLPLIKGKENES
ncbi:MAG: hypothetical protein M0P61_00270 [Ignavibacteriaceae bacterium]|jgi:hypothetical protein|nr:hypothetical protein [Ignavibacteriaceae bacterium]